MKNPYEVLNIAQDADKASIMKAQMLAMKERKYSLQEIQIAARQLLDPAKRLAADFMFPTRMRTKRPQLLTCTYKGDVVSIGHLDENSFNSLS